MTAASGIIHEEFHSPDFTQRGGVLEMVQLWINLPSHDKMAAPSYQAIVDGDIPSVTLPNEAGRVRVIAGSYDRHSGPARTFTPINVWDMRLEKDNRLDLRLQAGHTVAVVVLHGEVQIGAGDLVHEAQVALLESEGDLLALRAQTNAVLLVLSGEPINEPIVGHGPFVMNSRAEITQAIDDFTEGRFARQSTKSPALLCKSASEGGLIDFGDDRGFVSALDQLPGSDSSLAPLSTARSGSRTERRTFASAQP